MAEADSASTEQCKAVTEDGERCSRPAREDGFCYQHDESDQTVSETETQQAEQETEDETETDSTRSDRGSSRAASTDPEDVEMDVDVDDDRIAGVLAIRKTVKSTAGQLIGREFDGVSEISATEEGWNAVVEVVERRAVPDTQDIIGRYEIELDEDGVIQGYRRLDRYRRGDTAAFDG